MQNRLFYVIKLILFFIGIGTFYGVFISLTDISIPCLFYEKTGLYCPGCGISRMFLKLSEFDFYGAFRSNVCIFTMLPILIFYSGFKAIRYIRLGKCPQTKYEGVFIWCLTAILIVFGILRNFPAFSYLAPI